MSGCPSVCAISGVCRGGVWRERVELTEIVVRTLSFLFLFYFTVFVDVLGYDWIKGSACVW